MSVDMTLAMMAFVAALAVLCVIIGYALRNQPALVWLGSALTIGVFESFALKDGNITAFDVALTAITIPASYICVGQAVRAAYGARPSSRRYFALCAALVLTSLALLPFDVPPVLQTLFCQLAGVLALLRTGRFLRQQGRPRDLIDNAMFVVVGCLALVFIARIPLFPVLIERPALIAVPREEFQAILIGVFAVLVPAIVFLIVARVISNAIEGWRSRAERDFMTNLPNRRAFEDFAERDRARGGALILCDIDNFKSVNDRFGHSAGDAVICAFADLLESRGYAARIGGEEFAIWLPQCELGDAVAHAETLRREFETLRLVEIDARLQLSASFGLALLGRHTPLELATAQADAALYSAKNSGRNRVVVYGREYGESAAIAPVRISARAAA